MLANVFTKSLRDRLGGGLMAAASLGVMILFGLWAYRDVDISFYYELPVAILELMGIDPDNVGVGAMAFGAIHDFMGAFVVAGVAVSIGAGAIAGDEQAGTFGLLLGNPVSRRGVLVSKAASMAAVVVAIGILIWGAAVGSAALFDIDNEGLHLGAITVAIVVNALLYGMFALAIGAWTGRRGLASGTAVAVMVLGYLGAALLPLADLAELARALPWHYYSSSSPLRNGLDLGHVSVLLGLTGICFAAAWIGIERRDLKEKGTDPTLVDRLRHHPMTRKAIERIAGSARVSGITAKSASEFQGLLTVTAGIMFYMGIFIPIVYNLIPDDFVEIFATFPDALIAMIGGVDMSEPAGFVTGEVFSLVGPIAVIVLQASMGARALAGEEESRTMGLLLSNPVSRQEIVVKKAAAMVAHTLLFAAIVALGVWIGVTLAGQDEISLGGIISISVMLGLFGLAFGGVALWAGAVTGRKKLATWTVAGVGLTTWFMFTFLPLSESAAPWAKVSPFHWYLGNEPLANGMDWFGAALLAATFVVLAALSVPMFRRRDLRG